MPSRKKHDYLGTEFRNYNTVLNFEKQDFISICEKFLYRNKEVNNALKKSERIFGCDMYKTMINYAKSAEKEGIHPPIGHYITMRDHKKMLLAAYRFSFKNDDYIHMLNDLVDTATRLASLHLYMHERNDFSRNVVTYDLLQRISDIEYEFCTNIVHNR